jgi:hypothetical protein
VTRPIAIVQGAESAVVQGLFRDFVDRHAADVRIVGALEEGEPGKGRKSNMLRNLADGLSHPVFQDLGSGASGCSLDSTSVVLASEAVRADIARGCDLVVLSKFGKMEAESGSGLIPAFVAAIEAGVPVLTSVSPRFTEAWDRFASPFFVMLPAEVGAIDDWWAAVRQGAALYAE